VEGAAIEAFENRLGHRLPDDYRRFILEVNGGILDDSCRQFSHGVVTQLFGIGEENEDGDLEDANRWFHVSPSRELLYAGHDSSGTNILVALVGEHRGQVWIQDTADPRPDGSNPRVSWHDRRDMEKVADSFSEFLGQLKPLSR